MARREQALQTRVMASSVARSWRTEVGRAARMGQPLDVELFEFIEGENVVAQCAHDAAQAYHELAEFGVVEEIVAPELNGVLVAGVLVGNTQVDIDLVGPAGSPRRVGAPEWVREQEFVELFLIRIRELYAPEHVVVFILLAPA